MSTKSDCCYNIDFSSNVPWFPTIEVGFDTRDNFDESVPVVQDFLLIADEFQSSPSPLYAVWKEM